MLPLHHDQSASPALASPKTTSAASPGASASSFLAEVSSGLHLPKPLKAFPSFQEIRTVIRALAITENTSQSDLRSASLLDGPALPKLDAISQRLPATVTVIATGAAAAALMLDPSPATTDAQGMTKSKQGTTEGGFKTLQRTVDTVAQSIGLKRVAPNDAEPNETDRQANTEIASKTAPRPSSGQAPLSWTGALASNLSVEELCQAANNRIAIEAMLHDGMSMLMTEQGIRHATAELGRWLRGGTPLLLTALRRAGLLRVETLSWVGTESVESRLIAGNLGTVLRSLEWTLRSAKDNSAKPAALATALVQFYAALAAPIVADAIMAPAIAKSHSREVQETLVAVPTRRQTAAGSDDSSHDVLAVFRALMARDALTANGRDIAQLSVTMEQMLSQHQRGLQLLGETRGFLNAVRLTESSAGRNQPLGVLLESGRRSASAMAESEQSALISALSAIGAEGGAMLDRFALAARRNETASLKELVLGFYAKEAEETQKDALVYLNSATVGAIVAETRGAARLLRTVLVREAAAADALASRIETFENDRYS